MRSRIDLFRNRRTYTALDPEVLAAIDDDWLEQAIIDLVVQRAAARSVEVADELADLPVAFSHVFATWITEAEVFNGGFNQLFFNSSGRLAEQAAAGYAAIGAPERERIVREAMARLAEHGDELAPAWSERTLSAFSASYELDIFGELDAAFYALDNVEDGSRLRLAFIRTHAEELTAG